jgi:hypothetical protein
MNVINKVKQILARNVQKLTFLPAVFIMILPLHVGAISTVAAATCSAGHCDLIAVYVQPAIDMLAGIVGVVVVISLIMGGIQYSTAEGDPQKSSKAKDRISKTIIALVAFFFFYAFMQFLIPGGIFNHVQ